MIAPRLGTDAYFDWLRAQGVNLDLCTLKDPVRGKKNERYLAYGNSQRRLGIMGGNRRNIFNKHSGLPDDLEWNVIDP